MIRDRAVPGRKTGRVGDRPWEITKARKALRFEKLSENIKVDIEICNR